MYGEVCIYLKFYITCCVWRVGSFCTTLGSQKCIKCTKKIGKWKKNEMLFLVYMKWNHWKNNQNSYLLLCIPELIFKKDFNIAEQIFQRHHDSIYLLGAEEYITQAATWNLTVILFEFVNILSLVLWNHCLFPGFSIYWKSWNVIVWTNLKT